MFQTLSELCVEYDMINFTIHACCRDHCSGSRNQRLALTLMSYMSGLFRNFQFEYHIPHQNDLNVHLWEFLTKHFYICNWNLLNKNCVFVTEIYSEFNFMD